MKATKNMPDEFCKLIALAKNGVGAIASQAEYGESQSRLLRQSLALVCQYNGLGPDAKRDALAFYSAANDMVAAFSMINAAIKEVVSALDAMNRRQDQNRLETNLH